MFLKISAEKEEVKEAKKEDNLEPKKEDLGEKKEKKKKKLSTLPEETSIETIQMKRKKKVSK